MRCCRLTPDSVGMASEALEINEGLRCQNDRQVIDRIAERIQCGQAGTCGYIVHGGYMTRWLERGFWVSSSQTRSAWFSIAMPPC